MDRAFEHTATGRVPRGGSSEEAVPAPDGASIRVHLRPDGAIPNEFTPLSPPLAAEVSVRSLSPDLIEALRAEVELDLAPGELELPLTEDRVCRVEVPEGCHVRGWVTAERDGDEAIGGTIVRGAQITIDPPIVLRNIVSTLTSLPRVFEDRDLARLVARASKLMQDRSTGAGMGSLAPLLSLLATQARSSLLSGDGPLGEGLESLREVVESGADGLVAVFLRHASAKPVRRGGYWQLDLRFGGEVLTLDQVRVPFRKIRLPQVILPAPHAMLARLLSSDPLASAVLRTDRIPRKRLALELAGAVSSFRGNFTSKGTLPSLTIELRTADQGIAETETRIPGPVEIGGRFEGKSTRTSLEARVGDLDLRSDRGGKLTADLSLRARSREGAAAAGARTLVGACLASLIERKRPEEDLDLDLALRLRPGSSLPALEVRAVQHHPLTKGGAELHARISDLRLTGSAAAKVRSGKQVQWRPDVKLSFSSGLRILPESRVDDGMNRLGIEASEGRLQGHVSLGAGKKLHLAVKGSTDVRIEGATRVEALPELDIEEGDLRTSLAGRAEFSSRVVATRKTPGAAEVDVKGTTAKLTLDRAILELGPRSLSLPAASTLRVAVEEGVLATTGLGRASLRLGWDLLGRSPLLQSSGESVEIFVPDLRRGSVVVRVSPAGGLSVTGEQGGLYDARFFNALVNPGAEPRRWMEILDSDEAMDRVLASLRLFSREAADALAAIRRFVQRIRRVAEEEGIRQPRDVIPRARMARALSRILCGSHELEERLTALVKRVTDAGGLDVAEAKKIFADHLTKGEYEFELDRAVRWIDHLLSPTEPVPPFDVREEIPLAEDPRWTSLFQGIPSAGDLYRTIDGREPFPDDFSRLVAGISPCLAREQVEYVLGRRGREWRSGDLARLVTVLEIKNRVRMISENYGGLTFLPQATAISFFLGEAVRLASAGGSMAAAGGKPEPLVASTAPAVLADRLVPSDILLGPEDVAVLLQAGLASASQGRTVQLNQRMLLDLALAEPPAFLRAVLVEMGKGRARALAGVLYALLDLEQDCMKEPLDVVEALSARLGIQLPRLVDHMAGGRWARQSYYEALSRTAERILEEAEPYLALKAYLQVRRLPVPAERAGTPGVRRLATRAQGAIARANDIASGCSFARSDIALRRKAAAAYRRAFSACAGLLEADPGAFQLPWVKEFWSRNYESLMILSVVRNHQANVDRVRQWLRARTGKTRFAGEQALLETVINALYYFPQDRRRLKADPLTRLLIDPEPGKYDFTIVSAMGVITEGARGHELAEAYRRIEKERGVRVVRADTATARSLEYNAERIEEAVRTVQTPWGYIGYSQGCANGLAAESRLLGGTPDQQALAEGLRCRNLLFSAVNGSAHGTCGDAKFLRAMIEGDLFVKHYQAVFSNRAIRLFLKNVRLFLDSRLFVSVMGGVESLSHAGVRSLAREGQFKPTAPTSLMRGVVEAKTLPEALEFLANILTRQIESPLHDTQVKVDEAVGHPVWVKSPQTRLLEQCDMGALVQATHHWSPLLEETRFVTTERDIRQSIYDSPKDRHVFPWVETNARFGIIRKAR